MRWPRPVMVALLVLSGCATTNGTETEVPSRTFEGPLLTAEFYRLGRRIGVFASSPLMEAASARSFPPRSWRDLSGLTPAEIRSALISTLSSEPRPAASLPSASARDTARPTFLISMPEGEARSSPVSRQFGRLRARPRDTRQLARYIYDREALAKLLTETPGDRRLGDSQRRLCNPLLRAATAKSSSSRRPTMPITRLTGTSAWSMSALRGAPRAQRKSSPTSGGETAAISDM